MVWVALVLFLCLQVTNYPLNDRLMKAVNNVSLRINNVTTVMPTADTVSLVFHWVGLPYFET
jgi:hypothetical protein